MDYKPIDYESLSWKQFTELWTGNIKLRIELERLSKLTDIQKIGEMILDWAKELDAEREKFLLRISALGDKAGTSKFRQAVRQIDKDIARLSKLYSSIPSEHDADRNSTKENSWISYLKALGGKFDNYIDKDSPLDLRGVIIRAYKSRDLETFLTVTEKFFQLKRAKKDITNQHELAQKLWRGYLERLEKEEKEERLKL